MSSLKDKFIKAWERSQVELHGSYSFDRVLQLAKYTRETSWLHIILVLVVTPLPCLIITVLSDVLPLDRPSEGAKMNKMFQVREFYSFLVFSFLCMQQFRTSVRVLPYPNWRVVRNTVIVAFLTVAVLYGLALLIGFPVPFSLVISVPPWVGFITIFMANEWLRLIQENPGTGTMVFNTMKVLMCEVLLIVVYPPYFYVFTTLSKTGQMFFASLLPVIKLIMRNIFTMTVVHLSDEMPEVVVFNSEVFNALFVSYCLQNSPSIGTTLIVTAALLGQLALSLRDINEAVQRTEQVGSRLSEDHSDPGYIIMKARRTGRKLSALQYADRLLQSTGGQECATPMNRIQVLLTSKIQRSQSKDSNYSDGRSLGFDSRGSLKNLLSFGAFRIHPASVQCEPKHCSRFISATSLLYVLEVRRLLYLTEFLVLIYYVGVFIPLIFSIYMGAMYRLPNRIYYAQLAHLTEDELNEALNNILFNCLLKLASLLLLCAILQYRLRFSAIRQLAFVLEKQWPGVQIKICFWVFYNVQASLQHHGFDYTFKFAWLREDSASITNNSTIS